jgi:hypothetical protein
MVIQDRYVRSQQAATAQQCLTATAARAGITVATYKPNLANAFTSWGCSLANAKIIYKGNVCNGGSIVYTEIIAVDRSTGQMRLNSQRRPCRLLPGPNAPVNAQRFGSCGVAPALASTLPVRVCGVTSRMGGGAAGGAVQQPPGGAGGGGLPKVPLAANEKVRAGLMPSTAATGCCGEVGDMAELTNTHLQAASAALHTSTAYWRCPA